MSTIQARLRRPVSGSWNAWKASWSVARRSAVTSSTWSTSDSGSPAASRTRTAVRLTQMGVPSDRTRRTLPERGLDPAVHQLAALRERRRPVVRVHEVGRRRAQPVLVVAPTISHSAGFTSRIPPSTSATIMPIAADCIALRNMPSEASRALLRLDLGLRVLPRADPRDDDAVGVGDRPDVDPEPAVGPVLAQRAVQRRDLEPGVQSRRLGPGPRDLLGVPEREALPSEQLLTRPAQRAGRRRRDPLDDPVGGAAHDEVGRVLGEEAVLRT